MMTPLLGIGQAGGQRDISSSDPRFFSLVASAKPALCLWMDHPPPTPTPAASLFPHQSTVHKCHPSSTKEETEAEEVYLGPKMAGRTAAEKALRQCLFARRKCLIRCQWKGDTVLPELAQYFPLKPCFFSDGT